MNTVDRDDLSKSLQMMSGCVKALDHLPSNVLKVALLPMIEGVWPSLCEIL